MPWYSYIACFFAGAFLAFGVPNFLKGICGESFPTPFAKPPGKGLSSPITNVVLGLFDLALGLLSLYVGDFSAAHPSSLIVSFAGFAATSLGLSYSFGKRRLSTVSTTTAPAANQPQS